MSTDVTDVSPGPADQPRKSHPMPSGNLFPDEQVDGEQSSAPHGHADTSTKGGVDQEHESQTPQVNGAQAKLKTNSHGPPRSGTGDIKDKLSDKKDRIKEKTKSKVAPPGGHDATPQPDFPPGYTIKITFHGATNLPAADVGSRSCDPFIRATLNADVPKRHKEDPVLVHRTRTIKKTKEPTWDEEWIVANVPKSGFKLKCRLYDEDPTDHDDRLGNVTITVPNLNEQWAGLGADGQWFDVKKRMGSKRAYLFKAATSAFSRHTSMTPRLHISIDLIGRSDPPGAQMYTVGPTSWIKHFSPVIGRLAGVKVNRDEQQVQTASTHPDNTQTKKYDFQANEIQFSGPVPAKLYHRYVEFRPLIGLMFTDHGLRGRILNKALHKQHNRVYNFDGSTEYGTFPPRSRDAALHFLKMAHFDEGGRIFTYVLTLDGILRFTETGSEFGIDLLSKHTMHSDVATYIACSGEFFIRRLARPDRKDDPEPGQPTHPDQSLPGGPPQEPPPRDPSLYQLVIDNDSGTYRPDKSVLPELKAFLECELPGLDIVAMHWQDEELGKLRKKQLKAKKGEGRGVRMVQNRSPSSSSFSSDDEGRLNEMGEADTVGHEKAKKSRRERALDALEDPHRLRGMVGADAHGVSQSNGSGSAAATSS